MRVRPPMSRLTRDTALALADLATQFGSGILDLTNRANLQVRAVQPEKYDALLQEVSDLGLLDDDPAVEERRNIAVTPFWQSGDLTDRLAKRVAKALMRLPALPAKVGIAIDTGPQPLLQHASADFRFERGETGLVLRADGAKWGRPIDEDSAISALLELADWFDRHRSADARRMRVVVAENDLPSAWCNTPPLKSARPQGPGKIDEGILFGAAFGQIPAPSLRRLMESSDASHLRLMHDRLFLLENATFAADHGFITCPDDPALAIDACPGAPLCSQATVETRKVAQQLAELGVRDLHVSGCVKGCARSRPATTTLVGKDGRFDLVECGRADETATRENLTEADLVRVMKELE